MRHTGGWCFEPPSVHGHFQPDKPRKLTPMAAMSHQAVYAQI